MRRYWLDYFTPKTWNEFSAAGGAVAGFPLRDNSFQELKDSIQVGDVLICYLVGQTRFVAALEVTSPVFEDSKQIIWSGNQPYAARVRVKPLLVLEPETAWILDGDSMKKLSWYQKGVAAGKKDLRKSFWSNFRPLKSGAPTELSEADAELILAGLRSALKDPVRHALIAAKRAEEIHTAEGTVTIPPPDDESDDDSDDEFELSHTDIQAMLLKCGSDLGLDVWVARNDLNRESNGRRLCEIPNVIDKLPVTFERKVQGTIELIDVLWLQGSSIIKAFEIESTTSIYSGLLRMSDLVASWREINIGMYIVAPDERRNKVADEVRRPTFKSLGLPSKCRYVSFNKLKEHLDKAASFIKHLPPSFIDDIAETFES